MGSASIFNLKQSLNSLFSLKRSMKKRDKDFRLSLKKAQKDPEFIKEINKFIKATKSIYKLS